MSDVDRMLGRYIAWLLGRLGDDSVPPGTVQAMRLLILARGAKVTRMLRLEVAR